MSAALPAAELPGPVLIAGFGSVGRRHYRNLRQLGCQQFVFYRTRQGTIEDEEVAQWPSTSDLNEALSYRPCAAVVANPSALHMCVALPAARAGCHLLIEKPLSHSLEGTEELAGVVAEQRLVCMIGCQFRFHPLLASLEQQLRADRLGTVLGSQAEYGEYLPGWHPWEDYRQSYAARSELGGGVVLTLIHPLDYVVWLFGPVLDVQAAIRSAPSLETCGEDWADITLRHASDVVSRVHLDFVQRPATHRLSVWGEAGRAECDFLTNKLTWTASDARQEVELTPEGFDRNDMFLAEMAHFVEAVLARRAASIPLADGIAVLKLALAARQAAGRETVCG